MNDKSKMSANEVLSIRTPLKADVCASLRSGVFFYP